MKKEFILNGKTANEILKTANLDHLATEYNRQLNFVNKTGNAIDVTPLMAISAEIIEEKFYSVPIAEVMPVKIGNNPWGFGTIHYAEQTASSGFSSGIIGRGAKNSNLADVDVDLTAKLHEHINWAKQVTYSIAQLQTFSALNNYDYAQRLERARKRDWDLGLEEIAFLGESDSGVEGLFGIDGVEVDTTTIPDSLANLTDVQLSAIAGKIVTAYRANNESRAWPSVFVIPEEDYLALTGPFSTLQPQYNKLDVLLNAFKIAAKNPNFRIVPVVYASDAVAQGTNRYVLHSDDQDSLFFDIPADYQVTQFGTSNGFHFQNVGLGQVGGVFASRPNEILYFDVTPSIY